MLFPLKDETLRERICKEILPAYLADNRKAHVLGSNGHYTALRRLRNGKKFSVQEHLMELASSPAGESRRSRERQQKVTTMKGAPGAIPKEPIETIDLEVQDSSNATV